MSYRTLRKRQPSGYYQAKFGESALEFLWLSFPFTPLYTILIWREDCQACYLRVESGSLFNSRRK